MENNKKIIEQPSPTEFTKKNLEFQKKIGDGAYGQVWKVRCKLSASFFAVKQVQKSKVKKMISQFRREIEIMYLLDCPYIVKLLGHFEDEKNIYLVQELADNGNLFQILAKEHVLTESAAAQVFRELVLAVEHLHRQDRAIAHRDIKPENVLIDSSGRAKLADFGWAGFVDEGKTSACGTLEYLSPEMIEGKEAGVGVDIWCLGVLLFEMLAGCTPFKGSTKEKTMKNVLTEEVVFPLGFSHIAKDLIQKMLKKDKESRIKIPQVKTHKWLSIIQPIRELLAHDFDAKTKEKKNSLENKEKELVKIQKILAEKIGQKKKELEKCENEMEETRRRHLELDQEIRALQVDHDKFADGISWLQLYLRNVEDSIEEESKYLKEMKNELARSAEIQLKSQEQVLRYLEELESLKCYLNSQSDFKLFRDPENRKTFGHCTASPQLSSNDYITAQSIMQLVSSQMSSLFPCYKEFFQKLLELEGSITQKQTTLSYLTNQYHRKRIEAVQASANKKQSLLNLISMKTQISQVSKNELKSNLISKLNSISPADPEIQNRLSSSKSRLQVTPKQNLRFLLGKLMTMKNRKSSSHKINLHQIQLNQQKIENLEQNLSLLRLNHVNS